MLYVSQIMYLEYSTLPAKCIFLNIIHNTLINVSLKPFSNFFSKKNYRKSEFLKFYFYIRVR